MDEIFLSSNRRRLTLKRGKDRVVSNRHPWIFAGAIAGESGPADAAIGDLGDGGSSSTRRPAAVAVAAYLAALLEIAHPFTDDR